MGFIPSHPLQKPLPPQVFPFPRDSSQFKARSRFILYTWTSLLCEFQSGRMSSLEQPSKCWHREREKTESSEHKQIFRERWRKMQPNKNPHVEEVWSLMIWSCDAARSMYSWRCSLISEYVNRVCCRGVKLNFYQRCVSPQRADCECTTVETNLLDFILHN